MIKMYEYWAACLDISSGVWMLVCETGVLADMSREWSGCLHVYLSVQILVQASGYLLGSLDTGPDVWISIQVPIH